MQRIGHTIRGQRQPCWLPHLRRRLRLAWINAWISAGVRLRRFGVRAFSAYIAFRHAGELQTVRGAPIQQQVSPPGSLHGVISVQLQNRHFPCRYAAGVTARTHLPARWQQFAAAPKPAVPATLPTARPSFAFRRHCSRDSDADGAHQTVAHGTARRSLLPLILELDRRRHAFCAARTACQLNYWQRKGFDGCSIQETR